MLGRREIDGVVPAMVDATRAYLDRVARRPPGDVDLSEAMTQITLDVVGRALFGNSLGEHTGRLRPAVGQDMALAFLGAQLQIVVSGPRRLVDALVRSVLGDRVPTPEDLERLP